MDLVLGSMLYLKDLKNTKTLSYSRQILEQGTFKCLSVFSDREDFKRVGSKIFAFTSNLWFSTKPKR
jgi:hypothetical protein